MLRDPVKNQIISIQILEEFNKYPQKIVITGFCLILFMRLYVNLVVSD